MIHIFITFILYFFAIIVAIIYDIKSIYVAGIILIILGIEITLSWFLTKKSLSNNAECIIGKNKCVNGLFFKGCLDYHHILHVILYIFIGLVYPNNYLLIFLISLTWELYEHFMFKYVIKLSNCKDIICLRIEDIFLNLLGYFIGSNLKKVIKIVNDKINK